MTGLLVLKQSNLTPKKKGGFTRLLKNIDEIGELHLKVFFYRFSVRHDT